MCKRGMVEEKRQNMELENCEITQKERQQSEQLKLIFSKLCRTISGSAHNDNGGNDGVADRAGLHIVHQPHCHSLKDLVLLRLAHYMYPYITEFLLRSCLLCCHHHHHKHCCCCCYYCCHYHNRRWCYFANTLAAATAAAFDDIDANPHHINWNFNSVWELYDMMMCFCYTRAITYHPNFIITFHDGKFPPLICHNQD